MKHAEIKWIHMPRFIAIYAYLWLFWHMTA